MSYTPSIVILALVILGVVINFTVSQQDVLLPSVPHPPHIRATLDQPEFHFSEELQRRAVHLADSVSEGAEAVKDSVQGTVTATKEKIVGVKDKIKESAESDTVKEKAHDLEDIAIGVKDKIKESAESVKDSVKEKVHQLEDTATDVKENIKEALKRKEVKHQLKKKHTHWTERIARVKESVLNWLRYFFTGKPMTNSELRREQTVVFPGTPLNEGEEGEGFSEMFQKGKEQLGEVEEVIEGKAKGVKGMIKDKFSKVKESAKETVQGIKDKFGSAKEKVIETAEEGKEKLHKIGEHIVDMATVKKAGMDDYVYDDKDFLEDFRITYEYHYKKSEKPTHRYITTH